MSEVLTSDWRLIRRVLKQARPHLPAVAGVLLLELLATPLALLGPVPLQMAVDHVIHDRPLPGWLHGLFPGSGTNPYSLLLWVCGFSLLIALLGQLQSLASSVLTIRTSQHLTLDFRSRLFLHAERLSLRRHTQKGTADAIYRIQSDATSLEWLFVDGAIPLITSVFALVSVLIVVLRLNWQIGLTALLISPILFGLTRASRPLLRHQSKELKRRESGVLGIIQEVLGALSIVKAFGHEEKERDRFIEAAEGCVRGRLKLAWIEGVLGLIINMTSAAGLAAVLYLGMRAVLEGKLTLGGALLISSYIAQLYSPLKTLSRKTVSVQAQFAATERAFQLLDEPEDVEEKPDALPLGHSKGDIEFRDVSFSYDGKRTVLEGVSFHIAPGERVGIVGETGAGKTTLFYLLCRFSDPLSGAVLIDGVDIRDYRLADLRRQFAIVQQEAVLFATTIAENIAYGRPDAPQEDIEAAARAANIHDFIASLPDGYATRVGERGLSLSGGERQRLGLARAFLRDAPILILDEPTSAVDARTEGLIMDAMERLMAGRTTLLITHRPSTLTSCDRLLRVEGGTVHAMDSANGNGHQRGVLPTTEVLLGSSSASMQTE